MADFVGTAGGNTDNAKAEALNSIAQTGQSQSSAFNQAQANDAAAKTAALKSAMAFAALRGAPGGNAAQGQATIAAPLDQRATTLDTIKQNYAANNDATGKNFGQFFDLTKAGLPIAEQRYKEQAGQLQEKAAERAATLAAAQQSRQTANDLAAMRLQLEQQRLDKANAPETLGQFLTRSGGADLVGDQLKAALDQAPTGADQIAQPGGGHPAAGVNAVTDPMRDSLPDIVGGTPISPSLARTLMGNSEQKDNAQQLALTSAGNRANNALDPKAVNAGISSAANYFGSTKTPSFNEWWGGFVKANPNVDPATLTAIRDNTRPMFP